MELLDTVMKTDEKIVAYIKREDTVVDLINKLHKYFM